jgi:protocatechuate 3,4-dioxygenase beta subunit
MLGTLLYFQLAPPDAAPTRSRGEPVAAQRPRLSFSSEEEPPLPEPSLARSGAQGAEAQEPDAPDLPGTVSVWGTVTDANGRPLEGALVSAAPHELSLAETDAEAHTDAQGRFRLRSLEPGSYEVSFQLERFLSQELKGYSVTQRPEPLSIQLQPAPVIKGRVVDASGNPLAKATVSLYRIGQRASPSSEEEVEEPREVNIVDGEVTVYEAETRTGPDGTFILDTPAPERWRVHVEREGFSPVHRHVTSPARDVWLVMGSGASVEVSVVDERDRPVPGAQLDLRSEAHGSRGRIKASADEAGHAVLQGLEPGAYSIAASPPDGKGFRVASAQLSLRGELTQRVRLRFDAGQSLLGIVVDRAGRPIADVEFRARPGKWPSDEVLASLSLSQERLERLDYLAPHTTRSGKDGRFVLPHLLPVPYLLQFEKLGYTLAGSAEDVANPERSGMLRAEPGQGELRVVLMDLGRVSGRVVRADGEPITSFELDGTPHTSPDGTFITAAGPPGRHMLSVLAPGVGGLQQEYEAREGQDVDVGDLVLGEGRPVHVRVVEASSALPLRHVELELREEPKGRTLDPVELGYDGEPITDLAGRCELPDVPARPLGLTATHKGYEPAHVVLGPEEREVTLRLRRWATVRGRVLIGGVPMSKGEVHFYTPEGERVEQLQVSGGGFSSQLLRPGRYVARAVCDGCEEPEPAFRHRWVQVPGPGETLVLELEDMRAGATVEVLTFPSLVRLDLIEGRHPVPTEGGQIQAALVLRHPKERTVEPLSYIFRNVPAGVYTLLGLQELNDGRMSHVRQELEVPATGVVRLELKPRQ